MVSTRIHDQQNRLQAHLNQAAPGSVCIYKCLTADAAAAPMAVGLLCHQVVERHIQLLQLLAAGSQGGCHHS